MSFLRSINWLTDTHSVRIVVQSSPMKGAHFVQNAAHESVGLRIGLRKDKKCAEYWRCFRTAYTALVGASFSGIL